MSDKFATSFDVVEEQLKSSTVGRLAHRPLTPLLSNQTWLYPTPPLHCCTLSSLEWWHCFSAGLLTLEEMKEKQEILVKAREQQVAAKLAGKTAA